MITEGHRRSYKSKMH